MERLKEFWSKHDALISIVLFVGVVFFTHAPFFIYIPVPGVSMDTFNYYWFAQEIYLGKLPVIDQPHDFPFGYPLFLWFIKVLGGNIVDVVFVQTVVYAITGSWLIYQLSKSLKWGGLVALLALTIYTIQPYTINHNLRLLMESLYASGLLVLTAASIWFQRERSRVSFFFVLLAVLCSMLTRPNGILMVIIPMIFVVQTYFAKGDYKIFVLGIFALVATNIASNYLMKGKISFGDSKRINKVINKLKARHDPAHVAHKSFISNPHNEKISTLLNKYFFNIIRAKPSFYYSVQKVNYSNFIENNLPIDSTLRMFDSRANVDSFAPTLKAFVFNGFDYQRYKTNSYSSIVSYESPRNIWMFSIHLLYELFNKLKVAYLIYLIFWLTISWWVYICLTRKQFNLQMRLIFTLSIIHLLPLFLLPFMHNSFQARYLHVSEFIIYLVAVLGCLAFYNHRLSFNRKMREN